MASGTGLTFNFHYRQAKPMYLQLITLLKEQAKNVKLKSQINQEQKTKWWSNEENPIQTLQSLSICWIFLLVNSPNFQKKTSFPSPHTHQYRTLTFGTEANNTAYKYADNGIGASQGKSVNAQFFEKQTIGMVKHVVLHDVMSRIFASIVC